MHALAPLEARLALQETMGDMRRWSRHVEDQLPAYEAVVRRTPEGEAELEVREHLTGIPVLVVKGPMFWVRLGRWMDEELERRG